jgi:hypothetical protein
MNPSVIPLPLPLSAWYHNYNYNYTYNNMVQLLLVEVTTAGSDDSGFYPQPQ